MMMMSSELRDLESIRFWGTHTCTLHRRLLVSHHKWAWSPLKEDVRFIPIIEIITTISCNIILNAFTIVLRPILTYYNHKSY